MTNLKKIIESIEQTGRKVLGVKDACDKINILVDRTGLNPFNYPTGIGYNKDKMYHFFEISKEDLKK